MSKLIIETPTSNDIPQMRQWASASPELWAYEGSPWHSETTIQDYIDNPKDDLILVAIIDGTLAGMILVNVLRDWAYLSSLYVDPNHRKKGIGKALIKKALEHVNKLGIDGFHLVTQPGSTAVQFYEKLGFKKGYNFVWMRKEVSEAL